MLIMAKKVNYTRQKLALHYRLGHNDTTQAKQANGITTTGPVMLLSTISIAMRVTILGAA